MYKTNENTCLYTKKYMNVYSSIIHNSQKWEQHICQLNKLWYSHTLEYYSAMKRNEVRIHAIAWMSLENMNYEGSHIFWDFIYSESPLQAHL